MNRKIVIRFRGDATKKREFRRGGGQRVEALKMHVRRNRGEMFLKTMQYQRARRINQIRVQ